MNAARAPSLHLADVIVVGGGHAGAEAAMAAARAGARVVMVTSNAETIGQMSCNPAIGGVAKGTVVREVDALGGVMGRAADAATIQFRMLNRGKGPAVWAPRSQCDRALYREAVRRTLESRSDISIVEATVRRLLFEPGDARVSGIETLGGHCVRARSVVITTGTFLRGRMHVGTDSQVEGGRAGEAATTHLAEQLSGLGLAVGRFKTGTPPRIDRGTVDFSVLERQDSELDDFGHTWSTWTRRGNRLPQLPCWITFAGAATKAIVSDNLTKSAMYGGAIGAKGPRYCPSIEDKIVRFPAAERHQVFLEPEGLDSPEMYVNGLSTSLPASVQIEMLRSVPGLERVEMTRPGYAIEYDFAQPTQLWPSLEVRAIAGLYFAGQINGTTGYEEAAAQGLVAGLNAARGAAGREPVTFGRESSYIGVLIDDLVTRGVDEPYRLFTSRSEFRLTVRQNNALRRLAGLGRSLALYSAEEQRRIDALFAEEERIADLARETTAQPADVDALLIGVGSDALAHGVRVADLARRQGVSLGALFRAVGIPGDFTAESLSAVELELKYAGYLEKERTAAAKMKRMAEYELPFDAPYDRMRTLSIESRQKLARRRPLSLAQAASIPGVSPADLQNLVLEIERSRGS